MSSQRLRLYPSLCLSPTPQNVPIPLASTNLAFDIWHSEFDWVIWRYPLSCCVVILRVARTDWRGSRGVTGPRNYWNTLNSIPKQDSICCGPKKTVLQSTDSVLATQSWRATEYFKVTVLPTPPIELKHFSFFYQYSVQKSSLKICRYGMGM